MKLIQFPKKEKKQSKKASTVKGDFCFNWKDVELVECSEKLTAILHFKSGRAVRAQMSFEEARSRFLKTRR